MGQNTPDSEFNPDGFAKEWWDHNYRKNAFEDHLLCLGDEGFDFKKTWTDDYDCSVELGGVPPTCRLNADQIKLLYDSGFAIAFVNHTDGIETHYSKLSDPSSKGWRRKRTENGFVISYWPEGWTDRRCKEWLENGYMIVDPNL